MVKLNSDRNISGYKMKWVIGLGLSIIISGIVAFLIFKDFDNLEEGAENEL